MTVNSFGPTMLLRATSFPDGYLKGWLQKGTKLWDIRLPVADTGMVFPAKSR